MSYVIEENVPIPARRMGAPNEYPFGEMTVGQSFHVKGRENFERARNAALGFANRKGIKFSCRLDEDRDGGRIWRVE